MEKSGKGKRWYVTWYADTSRQVTADLKMRMEKLKSNVEKENSILFFVLKSICSTTKIYCFKISSKYCDIDTVKRIKCALLFGWDGLLNPKFSNQHQIIRAAHNIQRKQSSTFYFNISYIYQLLQTVQPGPNCSVKTLAYK